MGILLTKLSNGLVFILFLFLFSSNTLHSKNTNFKLVHELSIGLKNTSDTLSCGLPANMKTAAILIDKEAWTIQDLDTLACLISKIIPEEAPELYAVYSYINALAYRNFDDVIYDSLIQDAFFKFQRLNDIEGMFYCQSGLILSITYTEDGVFSGHNFNKLFETAEKLVLQTNYIPIKVAWVEVYLKKILYDKKTIKKTELDSLANYLKNFEATFPETVRLSYTQLAVQYQKLEELENALNFKQKALQLANPEKSDFPSFLANVGGGYYFLGELDSAKIYFLQAYQKIVDPNRIYLFALKSNIAQKLSVVYRRLNMPDSGTYYELMFLKYFIKKQELEYAEKLVYSAKKFEFKQLALEKAQLDLALAQQEKNQILLVFVVVLVGIIALGFLLLFIKTKRLEQQKSSLVAKRNKLLQIIGHDLSSPLHALATSAEIIPMLIENKRFDDLEVVQKSLGLSVEGLKSTIANLFAWNQSHSNNYTNTQKTSIPLGDFSRTLLSNYSSLQQMLNLNVMLKIESESISIKCDPMLFHQLMRNLLQNALKHSPQNTSINFNVGSLNQKATVTICNTFPVEQLSQIEKLAAAYNNRELSAIVAPGLGSELIFEAVEKLQVSFSATIIGNEFEVRVEHELA
jgi:signal transduction histidine kinase